LTNEMKNTKSKKLVLIDDLLKDGKIRHGIDEYIPKKGPR